MEKNQTPEEVVLARTPICRYCGEHGEVRMLMSEYKALLSGARVHEALPNHSLDDRELIISGTHPECWEKMWPKEDEEGYNEEDDEEDDYDDDEDYADKYYYGTKEDQRK